MAVERRIVRVANGRGRGKFRLRTNRRRKNAAKRRKLSPKQIRIFGTPQQKAALKRKRTANRTKSSSGNRRSRNSRPKVKVIYRYKANPRKKAARRRRSNPALVVTLGSINPKRRTSTVARRRTRRAKNSRRRRRSTNPVRHRRVARRRRVVHAAAPRRRRRTANPHRRRRIGVAHRRRRSMNRRHHRNPAIFGRSGGKDLMKMIGGGMVGVTVTKMIPGLIPASITSTLGSGSIMAVLVSIASAWVAGFLAAKVDKEFGDAVMFGGLMQAGSVALNAFLPSVGGTFSLGDLVDGNYVVPQNPIRAAGMGMGAPIARMQSAYGSAY